MSEPTRVQEHRGRSREEPATLPGEGVRNFLIDDAIPGTVAGLIGGALMLAVYMLGSSVFGTGPWDAPKMVSSVFRRSADLSMLGPADVLLGLVIHFGVACTLGVLFALALPRQGVTMFAVMPLALIFSMISYVILLEIVADTIAPLLSRDVIRPLWFISQLAFGATLALIYPMRARRWVNRRYVPEFVRREARFA